MHRLYGAVLVALLLGSAVAAQAGAPELRQWLPGESFAGGKQEDPRLDKPVQFWRAGLSLEEVFGGIAKQTGVTLAFYPADDENRRVRVHAFLNEKQPPSLREVMVQLAWVVDCPFSVAEEGGQKVYYLLATSIGRAAPEAMQERRQQVLRDMEAAKQVLHDRIAGFEEALNLPREEAIRRYRGSDDRMLLDLLDPGLRGALLLTAHHTFPYLDQNRFTAEDDWLNTGPDLHSLTPEERAALDAAFGPGTIPAGRGYVGVVTIHIEIAGVVRLRSPRTLVNGKLVPVGGYREAYPTLLDLRPGAMLSPDEEVQFRRLLGEQMTPVQEQTYRAERAREQAAAQEARQVKQSGASLSAQATELLGRTELALKPGTSYWSGRLAEAVARATGMHVLCDGLLYATASAPAGASGKVSALGALEALGLQKADGDLRSPEWEWGDAGSFLRLRTTNRDVWRAAFLPVATRDWLDAQLRPLLPKPEQHARQAEFTLALNPEQWTRQFAALSDLQVQYASRVLDGDPREVAEPARRAAWGGATAHAEWRFAVLKLLSTLTQEQWDSARQGQLRWPEGMTPDQLRLLESVMQERNPMTAAPEGITAITVALSTRAGKGAESTVHMSTPIPKGEALSGGTVSADSDPSAATDTWNRVKVTALRKDAWSGRERAVFDRDEAFLPQAVHVHAEAAE